MNDSLEAAKISICIIPQSPVEGLRLPSNFGKLTIVPAHSLRVEGKYTILDLTYEDGTWRAQNVEHCII
jgi:hypothetical protein